MDEICVSRVDPGYTWRMPVIPDDVELGTWDLADWVFGTIYDMWAVWLGPLPPSRPERLLWRVENWLRYHEWKLFFTRGEGSLVYRVVVKLRRAYFLLLLKIAWRRAEKVYRRRLGLS